MTRLDKLWRETGGPGRPPRLDSRRVRARVNAVLDAGQEERKIYMRQKYKTALLAAAAAALIAGSAFAAVSWDVLSTWFQGDTAPGQEYLDSTVRSVSDGDYSLAVEGSAGDDYSVYMTVAVTALSDRARAFLWDEDFISMDTFELLIPTRGEEGKEGTLRPVGHTSGELDCQAENTRRFRLAAMDLPCAAETLYVRCGYMAEGKRVEVPVSPAPSVTVRIGAKGTGILEYRPASAVKTREITVKEITLTPFTCRIQVEKGDANVFPRILLRMEDGSIQTQAQLMSATGGSWDGRDGRGEHSYRFRRILDLDKAASVILFGMEYPLDGSDPVPAAHDPALDPFLVKRMEPLEEGGGYSLPVRALTEGLGGTCQWDAAAGEAVCVFRGVTVRLRAGSTQALVDGEPVALRAAPAIQNGTLAAPVSVFRDAWSIDCVVQREQIRRGDAVETVWHDWYIVP